jgi:hypothetical protein
MFIVRSASISSYTVMDPISADIAEPLRPAISTASSTGASSLQMDSPTMPPSTKLKPRFTSSGPVCKARTPPMNSDKMHTIIKLPLPISKSWSKTLRRWRQASGSARSVCQNKIMISPIF